MMRVPSSTYLRKRHRTPHPAANIIRRNDIDLMDSVFSDTPAVATGETVAQIIAARRSKFTTIHGMKGTTEDDILFWALFKIVSVGMVHPRKLEAMMLRSIKGTASLIIAVICISAFGNLKRIIRIKIMLRMFGKLSSAASIECWILPARPPLGGYWQPFCLHKSGIILLMLTLVMALVLPTWLLPVA